MTGCATQEYKYEKVIETWKLSKVSHKQIGDPAEFSHFLSYHLGEKLCTQGYVQNLPDICGWKVA